MFQSLQNLKDNLLVLGLNVPIYFYHFSVLYKERVLERRPLIHRKKNMHTMTLYSDPNNAQSHRVRIVLGEKDLVFKIEEVLSGQNNEDLIALNPNNTTPTFVDRNLVLYESRVIMEYLDERFPHPPLMPVDPVIRAKTRMVLHYIEKDLYGLLDDVKSSGEKNPRLQNKN